MKHVAVLMGGNSDERELSRSSGAQVVAALPRAVMQVTPIEAACCGIDLAAPCVWMVEHASCRG
jgi:D-alanine-D-alanine ligase-like ATP-grasp enzyme